MWRAGEWGLPALVTFAAPKGPYLLAAKKTQPLRKPGTQVLHCHTLARLGFLSSACHCRPCQTAWVLLTP